MGFISYAASDGNGTIPVDGQQLTGGKKVDDGYWISDDRQWGYMLTGSGDLVISKDGNDKVVIEFAWDKEVELFGPVYLLIKYRGKSR